MPPGADPATRLGATTPSTRTLMLRRRDGDDWRVEHGRTFRDWVDVRATPPDADDLAAAPDHAVPAGAAARLVRGALPRRPAVAVVAGADGGADRAARGRRGAGAAAEHACAGLDDWEAAARDGLAAPGLQAAALACFDAALDRAAPLRRAPRPGRPGRARSATATSPAAAARPTTP